MVRQIFLGLCIGVFCLACGNPQPSSRAPKPQRQIMLSQEQQQRIQERKERAQQERQQQQQRETVEKQLREAREQEARSQLKQSDYKIVKSEDLSFNDPGTSRLVKRVQYRIEVSGPISKTRLRAICQTVIETEKRKQPVNAISFFFYKPGTDALSAYTAGKADWAPNGRWDQADRGRSGDYSRHKLVVETGSALGEYKGPVVKELSLAEKRKIFYDLVATQDSGVGDEKAYEMVAKKYGVAKDTVNKIAVEGALTGWPMP